MFCTSKNRIVIEVAPLKQQKKIVNNKYRFVGEDYNEEEEKVRAFFKSKSNRGHIIGNIMKECRVIKECRVEYIV